METDKLKSYKEVTLPISLYGSYSWIKMKENVCRFHAAEMKILRTVIGCVKLDKIEVKMYGRT